MVGAIVLKVTPQDSSRDWLRVDDPEAARYVVEPRARQFLEPFIGRERTASDVAAELGVATNAVLYRVQRMMALGLVTVTRTEPRRGRGVKYYRAVSDAFFAPFQVTSAASLEELFRTALQNTQDAILGSVARAWAAMESPSVVWGVYARGSAEGLETLAVLPELPQGQSKRFYEWLTGPEGPAVWDNTYPLRLTPEDAKALQRDLRDLQKRYAPRQVSSGKYYLVRTTIAPLEVEGEF